MYIAQPGFLAGKLKDSLRGHLTDDAQLAHTHSCTQVGHSSCCFVSRLMDEGRLVIGLKCFTVLVEGVGGSCSSIDLINSFESLALRRWMEQEEYVRIHLQTPHKDTNIKRHLTF